MKCEVCLASLEEYLDGELASEAREQVGTHLITCADCAERFAALSAEQELFARYDREVEVPPFLWTRVAAHTIAEDNKLKRSWFLRPARAIAMVLLAITVGVVYLISRATNPQTSVLKEFDPTLPRNGTDRVQARRSNSDTKETGTTQPTTEPSPRGSVAANPAPKPKVRPPVNRTTTADQSDVLSSDLAYLDMDEQDTAKHIEQTQNLLRSIKNFSVPDGEEEIDVTYDKALSRR
jgi:hypothetical protein